MSTSPAAAANQSDTHQNELPWLRAVMVFNLSPVRYAHPSWLPAGAIQSSTSLALRRDMSAALLAERGLSAQFEWQPTLAVMQPMLLSVHSHGELALAVGVMAYRSGLRQVVQRHLWTQWRELLGERLDLLWSPLAECVPNAPAARLLPGPDAVDTVRATGQAVLLGLLNPDEPDQALVLSRARLRLPRSRVLDAAAWQPKVAQAEALATNLMNPPSRWSNPWTWLS